MKEDAAGQRSLAEIPAVRHPGRQGRTTSSRRKGRQRHGRDAKGSEGEPLKIAIASGPARSPPRSSARATRSRPSRRRRAARSPTLVLRAGRRQRRRLGDGQGRGQRDDNVVNPPGFAMAQAAPPGARARLLRQPRPAAVGAAALPAYHRRHRLALELHPNECGARLPPGDAFAGFAQRDLLLRRGRSAPYCRRARAEGTSATSPPSSRSRLRLRRATAAASTPSPPAPCFVGAGRRHHLQLSPCLRAHGRRRTRCSASRSSRSTST